MIQLSEKRWAKLHARLFEEYRDEPSVLIIRDKTRRVLGFTVRKHREWLRSQAPTNDDKIWSWPEDTICLDFYDDAKETFFRLKYIEYL